MSGGMPTSPNSGEEYVQLQSWDEFEEVLSAFDPEFTGQLPKTIYAVKYRAQTVAGPIKTYIFLLGSKAAYDQRIAGPEKGQGMKGTVVWEAITPPVKIVKPPQEERLF